ncbi:hypothetical protein NT2_02_01610 [Caenibius tardaugens NBRC 16725]|uniref:DUF2218 domain-containing protein n=1 Tax=Caenibius tardaugens NBRC 16725 TaxID=1219035 RepID=U2ZZX3_9SPHN|nr:DUF2218 domain-containing protein [Caenibius tardaugens]AZI34575.1 DUF2218 domain-containing protein [Caenibius tardaugens NBRC 16725]GAD48078.1 hypothetical protein NT2_02_01610 [Caenibius tardaugens NBRC 16725]
MTTIVAHVPTANGGKYVRQLCKHWSHKLEIALDGDRGVVRFPSAVATMTGDPQGIRIELSADDAETAERMKGVIESHLDRFAFREAPLAYEWTAGA